MSSEPRISAIIPARNEEASIETAILSIAAQPEIGEIIVVNDHSTDRTADRVRALTAQVPQLRLLEAGPLPYSWVGKNYALDLGAAQAAGGWLLFTDADTQHLPASATLALADTRAAGAALVSYSPEQETPTWWERSLIPFVYTRLAQHFSFAEVNDPHSTAAAANGQYLLIRRDAYDSVGGHRAVSGEVLEDVALARRVKQAGHTIHFAAGHRIARVRMYRSFGAMWQGWTKNLYPLVGGSAGSALRELLSVLPWIPFILLALASVHRAFAALGLLLLAGRHAAYLALLRRSRIPASRILYYVPAVLLYSAVLLVSAWRYMRGTVVWKGREYSVGTPGK